VIEEQPSSRLATCRGSASRRPCVRGLGEPLPHKRDLLARIARRRSWKHFVCSRANKAISPRLTNRHAKFPGDANHAEADLDARPRAARALRTCGPRAGADSAFFRCPRASSSSRPISRCCSRERPPGLVASAFESLRGSYSLRRAGSPRSYRTPRGRLLYCEESVPRPLRADRRQGAERSLVRPPIPRSRSATRRSPRVTPELDRETIQYSSGRNRRAEKAC